MNKLARIPAEVHSMSDMDDWFVGYGIWQLKQLDQDEVNANGFPDDYWGFMDYDFALEHGFSKDAYEFVYSGWLMVDGSDVQSDGRESEFVGDVDGLLERVFETLNVNRPSDFTGHSLSMSDIVELGDEAYYVNDFGFEKLDGIGMWASRTASAPYASAEQMLLQVADRFEPGKWWSINWGASYSLGIIHADDEDDFLCQAENLLLNSGSMGQQDFSRYYVYGPQDSPDGFQGVALASRVAQETTVGDDPRRAALRQSLEGENKAIYDYQNWIDQLPDGDDVRIQLESIRDEEQAHIGELSQLLFELYPDEKNNFSDGQSEVTSAKNGSAPSQAFDADGVTVVVEPEFANGYVRIEMYEQANTDRHGNGLLLDMTVDFNGSVDDPYTDYMYTTTPTFNQDGTIDCEYMAFVRDVNGYGTKEFDGSFVASDLPSSFDELLMEPEFRSIYDEMLAEAKAEALSRSTGVTARRVGGRKTADTHYDSPTVKHSIRECYVNGDEDSIIEIAASCIIDAWLDWSGSNEPILEDRNNISGVLFNALMEELVEENDGEVTDQIRALAEDDTQRFYADALEEAQQAWASVMGSLPQRFASRHVADAPISRTDLYSGDGVACHDADVRHISTWGYRTGDEYEVVYIDSCSDPLMQDKYVIVSGSDLMYDYRFDTADAAESFLSDQGFYWMDDKTAQYIPMGHVTLPRDESEWTLDRQGFDGSKHWTYFDGSNSYYIDTTVTTDTQAIGEGMSSAEYAAMSDEERKEFIDELIAETSYDGVVGYGSTVSVGYGQMQGASFEEGVGRLEEFVNDAIDQMNDDTEYQIQRHSIGRRKQAGVKGSDDVTCHDDDLESGAVSFKPATWAKKHESSCEKKAWEQVQDNAFWNSEKLLVTGYTPEGFLITMMENQHDDESTQWRVQVFEDDEFNGLMMDELFDTDDEALEVIEGLESGAISLHPAVWGEHTSSHKFAMVAADLANDIIEDMKADAPFESLEEAQSYVYDDIASSMIYDDDIFDMAKNYVDANELFDQFSDQLDEDVFGAIGDLSRFVFVTPEGGRKQADADPAVFTCDNGDGTVFVSVWEEHDGTFPCTLDFEDAIDRDGDINVKEDGGSDASEIGKWVIDTLRSFGIVPEFTASDVEQAIAPQIESRIHYAGIDKDAQESSGTWRCDEDGCEGTFTLDELRDIYDTEIEHDDNAPSGAGFSHFEDWLDEMEHMQIYIREGRRRGAVMNKKAREAQSACIYSNTPVDGDNEIIDYDDQRGSEAWSDGDIIYDWDPTRTPDELLDEMRANGWTLVDDANLTLEEFNPPMIENGLEYVPVYVVERGGESVTASYSIEPSLWGSWTNVDGMASFGGESINGYAKVLGYNEDGSGDGLYYMLVGQLPSESGEWFVFGVSDDPDGAYVDYVEDTGGLAGYDGWRNWEEDRDEGIGRPMTFASADDAMDWVDSGWYGEFFPSEYMSVRQYSKGHQGATTVGHRKDAIMNKKAQNDEPASIEWQGDTAYYCINVWPADEDGYYDVECTCDPVDGDESFDESDSIKGDAMDIVDWAMNAMMGNESESDGLDVAADFDDESAVESDLEDAMKEKFASRKDAGKKVAAEHGEDDLDFIGQLRDDLEEAGYDVETFEDAGLMTNNLGLVIDGKQFEWLGSF